MTAWMLEWLWQGCALLALAAAAHSAVPGHTAASRYLLWFAGLVVLAWLGWQALAVQSGPSHAAMGHATREPIFPVAEPPASGMAWLLVVWTAGVLVGLLRLAAALRALGRLRRRCRMFPAAIERQLPLWQRNRLNGRRSTLWLADQVNGATVLGFRRPRIVVSPALVRSLSPEELDQIILHEHAHVQRRDDWARLAESVLSALLWMHPVTYGITRQIARERERACDEQVVAQTGDPRALARCLVAAAEVRTSAAPPVLMPAFLGGRRDLHRRVDVLLASREQRHPSRPLLAAAICSLLLALFGSRVDAVPVFGAAAAVALPLVAPAPVRSPGAALVEPAPAAASPSLSAVPRISARHIIPVPQGELQDPASASTEPLEALPSVGTLGSRVLGQGIGAPRALPPQAEVPIRADGWQQAGRSGAVVGQAAGKAAMGVAGTFARLGRRVAGSM